MKKVLWVLSVLLLVVVLGLAAAFYGLRAALAPLPGEWSVPLRLGPVQLDAGVPTLIRLATSPWGAPLLDGRSFETRHGRVRLDWEGQDRILHLHCVPCRLHAAALGELPLQVPELHATLRRNAGTISGEAWSGGVRGSWQAPLARDHLPLRLTVYATPIADAYAIFRAQIPEVQQARIDGRFSLEAQLTLPAGTLALAPRLEGFAVDGLQTEAWANAASTCSRRASRLTPDSWLARAVITAEDQRFYEHAGYDLAEMSAALARNQAARRVERGASTITQQLAKLLVTGDERSPVRKLRELLYAVEMERTLGKSRILRLYLDNAPWGPGGLCGAEAASARYFGVAAHELKPAQAAWLAAMLHNPVAEAEQWAASGSINLERAQWVAANLRGLPRPRRLALAEEMARMDWRPLWAEPRDSAPPAAPARRRAGGTP